ncbi:hypothetical protein B0T16DRAFT_308773, partial [Cercophora newfieldiana]
AYTVFEPECTTLKEPVNFVSTPNSRGTLEILWSSLFTIFACTWTIQHPNVPEQRYGRYPGWWGDFRWGLRHAIESLKLAVATILAPELVIYFAWSDFTAARSVCKKLEALAKQDGVPWTRTHGHFAVMGGFVVRIKKPADDDAKHQPPYHLTGPDLCYLRDKGHIQLPSINEEVIADRSKSDPLLKTLALGQILWSILQITVRGIRGLSISLLELSVLAFAACAILVYLLYWNKPKHINTTITVHEYDGEIPQHIRAAFAEIFYPLWDLFAPKTAAHELAIASKGLPIPTLSLVSDENNDNFGIFLLYAGTVLFGAIHLAGWNFPLPTPAEQILWRCATVFTTVFSLLLLIFAIIAGIVEDCLMSNVDTSTFTTPILAGLYVLARLFILVESFRTLAYLPVDAFESTWTASIPHF